MVMKLSSPGIDLGIVVSDLDRSLPCPASYVQTASRRQQPCAGWRQHASAMGRGEHDQTGCPRSPPEQPVIPGGIACRRGRAALLTFSVADLDELMADLKANGVPVIHDVTEMGRGWASRSWKIPTAITSSSWNASDPIARTTPAHLGRTSGADRVGARKWWLPCTVAPPSARSTICMPVTVPRLVAVLKMPSRRRGRTCQTEFATDAANGAVTSPNDRPDMISATTSSGTDSASVVMTNSIIDASMATEAIRALPLPRLTQSSCSRWRMRWAPSTSNWGTRSTTRGPS